MSSPALPLWLLAVLFYGVGDLVTTLVGLRHADIEEGQPVARTILGEPPSAWRFGLFKAVLLTGCYVGYVSLADHRVRHLVPVTIIVIGVYAVSNNVRAIRAVR